jgi:hypothetical protein
VVNRPGPVSAACLGGCLLCLLGCPGKAPAAQSDSVLQCIRQRAGALTDFAVDVRVTETSYHGGEDRPVETLMREHHLVSQNGSFRETYVVSSSDPHGMNMQHESSTFPQQDGSGWVRQDFGENNGRKSLLTTHAGARCDFSHSCAWDAFLGLWGPTEYRNHPVALWGRDEREEHYTLSAAADEHLILRHQPHPRSDIYEMHVRTDLGGMISQVSRFAPEGMLLEESRVSQYTVRDGVVVPTEIEYAAYERWEGRTYQSLARSMRINVVTLSPDMPDTYFHLEASDRGIHDKLRGLRLAGWELHDQDYLSDIKPFAIHSSPPAGRAGTSSHAGPGNDDRPPPKQSIARENQPATVGASGGESLGRTDSRWRGAVWPIGLVGVTILFWFLKRKRGRPFRSLRPSPERSA